MIRLKVDKHQNSNKIACFQYTYCDLFVCTIPYHQSGFQPHSCIPKRMNNACEQGIGRFLCKGEEAGAWMSTKCLQLSLLFIHLFFIESWKATDKPTNVLLLKQGRRNWLLWCRGTFKVNLPSPSAVIIISPYSHQDGEGEIQGSWRWHSFHSLVQHSSVCSSLEMQFAAAKIIAVYCQLN